MSTGEGTTAGNGAAAIEVEPDRVAGWLQEDPGAENDHVEYPRLTAPTFRHVTVNAVEPPPGSPNLFSQWMSANYGTLGTTSLHADSFTLKREPPVGALAAKYLRLSEGARVSASSFSREFSSWSAKTPYALIESATSRYIEATREADRVLLAAGWPQEIQALVRASVQAKAGLVANARPPAAMTSATFTHWSSALTEASQRARRAGRPLLLALGLPGYL